jgi:tetratricopeptide (TPR) repeat protein
MGEMPAMARCRGWVAALLVGLLFASPGFAQQEHDDTAARQYFERGREAFEQADYESSLVYFQHAYRLSGRGELQYNIGVAADRLQREEEALEAFELYLSDTEKPEREAEVRERINALRKSIEERKATARALEEAALRYQAAREVEDASDGKRVGRSALIGGSALAALGVGGVAAMAVALARDGACADEVAGRCVTESAATAWTWVYGGLGLAALAGSAAWISVDAKRRRATHETEVSFSPTGFVVSGKF